MAGLKTKLKSIILFLDKLEDKIRGRLSHYPIVYALVGGIGIVLFWRGVWHVADSINIGSVSSIVLGTSILLLTGVFVSSFIGSRLIISGLAGEKKISEKTEAEIESEETEIQNMKRTLNKLEEKLEHIDKEIEQNIEK